MKPYIVISIAATTVALLILVTVIIITEKDVTPFLIALAAIPGALGAMFGVQRLSDSVEIVKKQTNGNLTTMMQKYESERAQKEALLSLMTPSQIRKIMEVEE